MLGLSAALFLLWVDAGQRCRELRHDFRLTFRERLLILCLVVGFALGALSLLCAPIMGVVEAVALVRSL